MKELIINSADEMKELAAGLAELARPGDVFCLEGELGAGKTTFVQGFITALQKKKEPVTSPTFNLVQIYKTDSFPIYHCDLYRLKSPSEFNDLGLEDIYDKAVVLIEWPGIASDLLPVKNAKTISIEIIDNDSRKVIISSRLS